MSVGGYGVTAASSAGVFLLVRGFSDVRLKDIAGQPLEISQQVEAGLSLSLDPAPRLWLIVFPWIGIGYTWAGTLSGVTLYLSFPL